MQRRTWPWTLAFVLIVGLGAIACGAAEDAAEAPAVEEPAEEMPAGLDRGVLADAARPEEEVAQDEYRKALEVYEFFGIEPGMTVADVWPGGGYNTHLLSRAMGDAGTVYAVMEFYAEGNFATLDALTERVANDGLDNVQIAMSIPDVPAGSLDVAVAVRNYHDAEQFGGGRQATVGQLLAVMKPGGIVGIVEVATPHEGWHEETHRLNEQTVIDEFTAGGFELAGSSDILRNPDDDHTTSGFDDGRYKTDRYVLKFRKP